MTTIFCLGVDFDKKKSSDDGNLTFSRRYLDANRLTYEVITCIFSFFPV